MKKIKGRNPDRVERAKASRQTALALDKLKQWSYDELLGVVKSLYLKHHCGLDNEGWNELGDKMCDALCNAMGDKGFARWLALATKGAYRG